MTSPSPTRRLRIRINQLNIRQGELSDDFAVKDLSNSKGVDSDDNDENLKRLSISKDNEGIVTIDELDVPKDEKRRLHTKSHIIDDEIVEDHNNKTNIDDTPLPKKKSPIEKYLKFKQREEQIKQYNESMIKETREERAIQRQKIREREKNSEEADTDSIESSPSKKVRFRLQ